MTTITRHGLNAIQDTFTRARQENRAAFIPYFPVGYPDYQSSLAVLRGLAEAGSDIIEVGVPFSDPLADGPTIQAATQRALENGITPRMCVEAIRTLREEGIQTPMVLMGYANPFMAYGYAQLLADAQAAGVDGFIVPDMPPDEASFFQSMVVKKDLALAHFLAPTSSPARIQLVAEQSRGYIYLVSVTGVTGARSTLPPDLIEHVEKIRAVSQQPVAIGFGIGTPEQAREVGGIADGIIVGSALIKAASEDIDAVTNLASQLRQALG